VGTSGYSLLSQEKSTANKEAGTMIVLGVILLIVGFLLGIPILWTIGIVLAVVGAVFAILGGTGRRVGGRAHWF
jgi:cell division protein FtsW (lipid II flippase)